jgi:protocatechuate 3,4-dioxygenase beta subunit
MENPVHRQQQGQDRALEFEGRALARPNDEVVDQGLGFDIGTLLSRRSMLTLLGLGTASVGLVACGSSSGASSSSASASTGTSSGEIPDETAGPYPGDGSNGPDVLGQSGIVRSDIRSSLGGAGGTAEGVPMTLELTISDLAKQGVPFAGVAVYVWHCNRAGEYSMYSQGITDENYLRGVQIADANGRVKFSSIFPACYSGRWPHIHFEVYPSVSKATSASGKIATSQIALPEDACRLVFATDGYRSSLSNLSRVTLATDNVFGDGYSHQLGTVTGSAAKGFTVALSVPVSA